MLILMSITWVPDFFELMSNWKFSFKVFTVIIFLIFVDAIKILNNYYIKVETVL